MRTILIQFPDGIIREDFEELYNDLYDKLTTDYRATLLAGNLTISGS